MIKATSICTDLLSHIYSSEPATKSVFVYNRPETHIATLLAGQNALVDLKGFAQLRLQRLQHSTGLEVQLNQLSPGQLAALSWLSKTTSATRSLGNSSQQIVLLEFESLLARPADTLSQLLQHLDIPVTTESVDKAVRSPVLQTYSKAPEHQYNAQTRAAILADSRSRFGQEIGAALAAVPGRCEIPRAEISKGPCKILFVRQNSQYSVCLGEILGLVASLVTLG